MRMIIAFLLSVFGACGAVCTASVGGNRSAAATWGGTCAGSGPNGTPAIGDVAFINNVAVAWDTSDPIGEDLGVSIAGTGTVTASGQTVTGTNTAFLTQLRPGDAITVAAGTYLVNAVTNDTTISVRPNLTVSGSAFTIRKCAVYTSGATGSVTVPTGQVLVARGDLNFTSGGHMTLAAGSALVIGDGAVPYRVYGRSSGGSAPGGVLAANGTANSRVSISSAAYGYIAGETSDYYAWSFDFNFTDFIGIATVTSYGQVTSGLKFKFDHCTFSRTGSLRSLVSYGGAHVTFTNNRLISLPPSVTGPYYTFLTIQPQVKTTGDRTITNNVLALPNILVRVDWQANDSKGLTMSHNLLGQVWGWGAATAGSQMAAADDNLFYVRTGANDTLGWTFLGDGGDTISNSYFLEDEAAQNNDRSLMSGDSANRAGTWKLDNFIFERANLNRWDVTHASSGGAAILFWWNRVLMLPNPAGISPGQLKDRGNAPQSGVSIKLTHGTLMGNTADRGTGVNTGALEMANLNAGSIPTGAVTNVSDNLLWSSAAWAGAGGGGYLAVTNPTSTDTSDMLVAGSITNNAYWNASTGTLYDQNGANGTAVLGWDRWRQTVKPTFATDINLGSGTDARSQGPRFVDTTRNIATFDSAYLGNSAAAWGDGHTYAVGDVVSASTLTFYGGAVINYRCWQAHTSNAVDASLGKPGSAASYRTYWEFASIHRIADAIVTETTLTDARIGCTNCTYIQALSAWVRQGFTPVNPAVWCAASDGGTIGAVEYCAVGKALLAAVQ
jgi:hypothetical protein